jgi:hypothetical protein
MLVDFVYYQFLELQGFVDIGHHLVYLFLGLLCLVRLGEAGLSEDKVVDFEEHLGRRRGRQFIEVVSEKLRYFCI